MSEAYGVLPSEIVPRPAHLTLFDHQCFADAQEFERRVEDMSTGEGAPKRSDAARALWTMMRTEAMAEGGGGLP